MILAVIGVLICLALMVGGWMARGQVNAAVREFFPVLESELNQETSLLERANELLVNTNTRLGAARTRVAALVDNTAESVEAMTSTINDVVQSVVTPIQSIRGQISALRTSVNLFVAGFNSLPSILGLPDIPTDRLEAIDERAQAIDQQLNAITNRVTVTQENLAETRANVVATLDSLQDGIANLATAAQVSADTLESLRISLPAIQSRINIWMTLIALGLSLLALCGAALFANLFYSALHAWKALESNWETARITRTTTATQTAVVEGAEVVTTTVTVTESKTRRPTVASGVEMDAPLSA